MRKKRIYINGAIYHVTSRTNDRINVFESRIGQAIMLMILEEAKEKFKFTLHNFCIMPNHIHLLLTPQSEGNITKIMQWIKTHSAKRWNRIHGSTDHLWGERFFARIVSDMHDYITVFNYIEQNPVKAGLVTNPSDWEASGLFYSTWCRAP